MKQRIEHRRLSHLHAVTSGSLPDGDCVMSPRGAAVKPRVPTSVPMARLLLQASAA